MAYATTAELESRWRALTPEESVIAGSLLDDAATILDSVAVSADDMIKAIVSCNMVRRAMTTSGDAFGLDGQNSDSYGWSTSLPAGDLWLSAQDRRMLKGRAIIGSAKMEFI